MFKHQFLIGRLFSKILEFQKSIKVLVSVANLSSVAVILISQMFYQPVNISSKLPLLWNRPISVDKDKRTNICLRANQAKKGEVCQILDEGQNGWEREWQGAGSAISVSTAVLF